MIAWWWLIVAAVAGCVVGIIAMLAWLFAAMGGLQTYNGLILHTLENMT